MPKSMRVKTRFEASEDVSKIVRRIDKNTLRMNNSIQRGFRKSTKSALHFKSVMKGVLAASVIQKGFNFIGQGIRDVSVEFVDFGNTITEAALKFGDIGPRAENFNEKLKEIEISARKAGAATKFTAPQAAKALLLMAKAGFTSAEAMGALRGQIDFAIASGEDFELSTRISTKLLGAFGLNVKNTEQKIKNLSLVNDTLTTTVNNSSIGLEELFDAMKDIGPIARNLNTDIVDVAAMAGVLGNEGLDATKAMTGMRSIFLNLSAPSTKGAKLLKGLGLTLDSGAIKAKNMTGFLFELIEATKDFGETQRAQIFRGIFGKTGITAATILSQGAEKVDLFKKKIKAARGEVSLMSKVMQTTLKGRILELNSALTELGFKVLDPFEKKIKNSIIALTEFFRGQDAKPLIKTIQLLGDAFEVFGGIVKISMQPLNDFLANFKPLAKELEPLFNFLLVNAKKLDKLLPEEKVKVPGALELLLIGPTEAIKLQTKILEDINKGILPGAPTKEISEEGIKNLKNAFTTVGLFTPAKGPIIDTPRKKEFSEGGLLSLLVSLVNPEFAAKRNEEMSKAFLLATKRFEELQAINITQPELSPTNINQPELQPQINVDVQNNINAKNIEVETTVTAPGTSGKTGVNKF